MAQLFAWGAVAGIVAAALVARQKAIRTTVLEVHLDEGTRGSFERLSRAFADLRLAATWYVSGHVRADPKYNASVESHATLGEVYLKHMEPWYVKTGLQPFMLAIPRKMQIHVLPGFLLVSEELDHSAVLLSSLSATVSAEAIPYEGRAEVPAGVEILRMGWKYANKDGTPDQRFASNYQVPIIRVYRISLTNQDGFRLVLATTDSGVAHRLQAELRNASALPLRNAVTVSP